MTSKDKLEDPEKFQQDVENVCTTYRQAQALEEQGIHVASCDERTGIQALHRIHPTLPTRPGLTERREFEYERTGTLCLIANFLVATGKVLFSTIGSTRTEEDFAAHIRKTVSGDPDAGWVFVVDQLNTHMSEQLVRLVAGLCHLDVELGVKGKRGILKSMKSRKAFLSDTNHRIRFVYTPRHSSWLNQVEIWFSILTRRLIKRGNFSSVEDLRAKLLAFIEYFNAVLAKPFKWTYTGRPLVA